MRVAMLYPSGGKNTPRELGFRERLVSILSEGLEKKGLVVARFAVKEPETEGEVAGAPPLGAEGKTTWLHELWESLPISGLFERGDEFDLIHNHLDCLPLTYMKMTSTPVLTTIHDVLSPEVLPFYRKYNGWAYYLAANDAQRHPELSYIATLDHHLDDEGFSVEQFVGDYLSVYQKIVAQRHREDHRPWGYYRVLEDELDHKVKRIVVYPGERLSLQRHRHRAEHWMIIQGKGEITRNQEIVIMECGQAIDIPQGAWHRVRNLGADNLAFIEVQTGDYFGEDDIERAEDDYGRV
jgi:mannose-6-phosphate isomerase-like protein (cupin superfamily)